MREVSAPVFSEISWIVNGTTESTRYVNIFRSIATCTRAASKFYSELDDDSIESQETGRTMCPYLWIVSWRSSRENAMFWRATIA